ncbi:RICIN domain-containing protein [Streptantibioticus parmotrematis]|uniref:RICIN domain-containing protein n=1 Tax=Streptantibioticus parmotrematis TaxID=2873249 RepID=UPI0033CDCF08
MDHSQTAHTTGRSGRRKRAGLRGAAAAVLLGAALAGGIAHTALATAPAQESIEAQISHAVASGAHEVTLQPGVYRRSTTLDLGGLNGFTVDAQGVTIVQTALVQALSTGTSDDLTVDGLTINYDPLPFTQGRVVDVAPDGKSWMDVQISQGYPRPGTLPNRVTTFDPQLRLPKGQMLGAIVSWQNEATGIARSSDVGPAHVGDIVTFAGGASSGPSYGITADGSDTTFKDVTLNAAPGMGFMNATGDGDTHLEDFHIVPGPPPPGATEKPILTTTWDAIQFQSVKKGPTIENSSIVNAGDDSVSIQGIGSVDIVKTDGSTVWAAFADSNYRVGHTGDRLQRWADGPTATITSLTRETDPAITKLAGSRAASTFRLTLDRPSPWSAGQDVTDIDRMGNGFTFTGNDIDSSGRGFLLKARDGVIENNRIRGANAISVTPEATSDSHAGAGGQLTIKGNTFLSALWSGGGIWNSCEVGAVTFAGGSWSERDFPDVDIENNVFQDIRGLDLDVSDSKDVTVNDNVFQQSQQIAYPRTANRCDIPKTSVVDVRDSDDVAFQGNTIDRIGPYSMQQVAVDPKTTTGVTGLPDGVKVVNPYLALDATKTYTLTDRGSGLLLTAAGSDVGSGATQRPADGSGDQGWRVVPAGGNAVRIRNGASGPFLTAGSGSAVTLEPQSQDSSQLWQLLDTGNGTAKISNVATGDLLDVSGGSSAPGADVVGAQVSGELSQDWQFTAGT